MKTEFVGSKEKQMTAAGFLQKKINAQSTR
jgi:hypothetical protein